MNQLITTFRWMMLIVVCTVASGLYAQIGNNSISGSQTICSGSTPNLLMGTTPTSSASIAFQWQVSTTSSVSGFSDITLATDTNYQATALNQTSWFRRIVSDGVSEDTSNVVELTVLDIPVAAFTVNHVIQCSNGNNFEMTNNSDTFGQAVSYFWSFGDGNVSILKDPSHTYAKEDNYTIRLKVINGIGCQDSADQLIRVDYSPLAAVVTPGQTTFCGSGQQLTIYADTTNGDYHRNKLVIIYDASRGQTGLSGASKVYMHSGLSQTNTPGSGWTNIVGNWGQDDGIGEMTSLGNNKWRIAIDVHQYYGLGINDSVKYIAMVFRNADGTATGKDNNGDDIFINAGDNSLSATFNGVKANYQQSFQWYKNNAAISAANGNSLNISASGDYAVEVDGHLGCTQKSAAITITFNPSVDLNLGLNQTSSCFNNQNLSLYDSSSVSSGSYTRTWDFGDGNSDTSAFPIHQYSSFGNYRIYIHMTTDQGCTVSDSFDYQVLPAVVASIDSVPATKVCGNGTTIALHADTTQVGYRSNKIIITYDATTGQSGLTGASKVYMHAGLSASNTPGSTWTNVVGNWGQDDGIGQMTSLGNNQWQIALDIDKYFGIDPRQAPAYLAFVFRNEDGTATGKDASGDDIFVSLQTASPASTFSGVDPEYYQTYQWYRNDTLLSGQTNPDYAADISGDYAVEVDGGIGCTDRSQALSLTFGPLAEIKLYVNQTEACEKGNQFDFLDSSSILRGNYTRVWNFGDGATDTAANPSHSYAATGTYTVRLTLTSDIGCITEDSVALTVNPSPQANASINNASQCFNGHQFDVMDQSSLSSGIYSVVWNWGDGTTDSTFMASHVYSAPSSYYGLLTVTSDKGCVDTIGGLLTVYASPVASLSLNSANAQCLNGNTFDFSDNSSVSGAYTRTWDFGNGAQDTASNVQYSYTGEGNYDVMLMVTSSNGCHDTDQVSVDVYPSPLTNVSINAVTQCFNGNNFIAYDSSTISSGTLTRMWNFGDGTTDTAAVASHSYASPGSYDGYVIITSDRGCIDSTGGTLTVLYSPIANGTIIGGPQCLKGNSFDFYDSSVIAQGYTTRTWDFGDGQQDTNIVISHSYNTYGDFMVKLISTSDQGCTDTLTDTISIYPHPVANATLNSFAQCFNGNYFMAYDSSTIASGSYTRVWNYGDGYTDTAAISSHSYAAPGNYIGYIMVTSDQGCTDSLGGNIVVYESPKAKLISDVNSSCFENNVINFTDSSSISVGNLTSIIYFGDSDSSTSSPVAHSYANFGNYNAYLVTSSVDGCNDTAFLNIQIHENPVADFSINNSSQCLNGNSFSLTNNATISSGALSYGWNFGDGNSDTASAPVYVYNNDGNYTITLIATSAAGCTDTVAKGVDVHPAPVAKWAVDNNTQCLRGNSFSFSDSSAVKTGSVKISWDFGNGVTDTISNPVIVYASAQKFNVELTATTDKGCVAKASGVVTVNANPNATVTADGSLSFCDGKNVKLSTIGGFLYQWMRNNISIAGANDSMLNVGVGGDYKVVVASLAGCTDTSSVSTVTVIPKSNFAGITGATTVSPGATQSYTINNVSGLTYNWSVFGGNIISGQGTSAVQVQWTNPGNGRVIVSADCYKNDTLNVSIVGGISNQGTLFAAEVYPNPTNDIIQVKLPEHIQFTTIQLYDLNGKLVHLEGVNGRGQVTLDMQSLSAGVYQLVITGDGGSIRHKVVLNK